MEKLMDAKMEAEKTWRSLCSDYKRSISFVAGCGTRGQRHIDASYAQLLNFTRQHPEYEAELPKYHWNDDDGFGGLKTGIALVMRQLK
jgi:hypothetical protein